MTFSDEIRQCRDGVADNPYQGKDKKVLFVCSMGILRSATGARLYAKKYNTRAAGTYNDALVQITPVLTAWANELVFVNKENLDMFLECLDAAAHQEIGHKIVLLNIPDKYPHMHPKLIESFKEQYEDC